MGAFIYYAHSMRTYGTRKEKRELRRIQRIFPNSTIGNPRLMIDQHLSGGTAMLRCLELVRACDTVVFSEYEGHIGKGIYTEITLALKLNKYVYLLRGKKFHRIYPDNIKLTDTNDWAIRYARVSP